MPCCAFALFVIGQLLAGLLVIRRLLGFSGPSDAPAPVNPATAWQLHPGPAAAAAAPRAGRRRLGRVLLWVGVLEIGLVVAGFAWLHGDGHAPGAPHAAAAGLDGGSPEPALASRHP